MPKRIRSRAQAKKDRAQLNKLKSTGLFGGKIDARKAPTPAQKRALKRYANVISGKAKVLTPKSPRSYKGTFRVVGNKVIVPRRKGERVRVDKSGEILLTRKIGGRKRTGTYRQLSKLKGEPGAIYVLPLMHGDEIEYYQFGSRDELNKFVFETSPKVGQTFKNFANYVLEIDPDAMERAIDRGNAEDEDDYFDQQLQRQLSRRRRKRRAAARKRRK